MNERFASRAEPASVSIYFADFFGVAPQILEDYGAFNVSLINDLPLFIDPVLLFDSDKAEYRSLQERIIDDMEFLRDVWVAGGNSASP